MADPPPESSLATASQPSISDTVTSPIAPSDKQPSKSSLSTKIATLDGLIAHFHRVIQTREGLDLTLLFATEAARLVGAILDLLSRVKLRKLAQALLILTSRLPKPISASLPSVSSVRLAAVVGGASTRLQALAVFLEQWQILSRLWGIFDIWMSTKELAKKATDENEKTKPTYKTDIVVGILQQVTLASLHLSEAVALLSSKYVLKWSPDTQDRLFLLAARSWGAFSCVEAVRLTLEYFRKRRSEQDSEDAEWRKQLWKEFAHNLAWLPLAMHWNKLPEGLFPEIIVGIIGVYPTLGYMKDIWQATA